jgi:hypothetical protein
VKNQKNRRGQFVGATRAPVEDPKAFVTLELDRNTGELTIDLDFAGPLEAWAMCHWAADKLADRLGANNE